MKFKPTVVGSKRQPATPHSISTPSIGKWGGANRPVCSAATRHGTSKGNRSGREMRCLGEARSSPTRPACTTVIRGPVSPRPVVRGLAKGWEADHRRPSAPSRNLFSQFRVSAHPSDANLFPGSGGEGWGASGLAASRALAGHGAARETQSVCLVPCRLLQHVRLPCLLTPPPLHEMGGRWQDLLV